MFVPLLTTHGRCSTRAVCAAQLLPLSDEYFAEESGELRIVSGMHTYQDTETITIDTLRPRIDGQAFSITAWVETRRPTEQVA